MERPRLRPLEAFPVMEGNEPFLALRDPSGLAESLVKLPPLAAAVVQLFDGEWTRDEVCAEFLRRYSRPLGRDTLDKLLAQLDDALLLDSDRFRNHSATIFADFGRAADRKPHLAGKSYPRDAADLRRMLDGFFDPPNGPGKAAKKDGGLPKAIVAPHVDFPRGGPAYAWAYKPLAEAADAPDLVVVFGTNHNGVDQPFALTKKDYVTPLGTLPTDGALVDELVARTKARAGDKIADALFYDEHHHRAEHSIEFQSVWLNYLYADRPVKLLPILTGSFANYFENDPSADVRLALLSDLSELVAKRRVLFVAAADLAHVGPRYGDPDPLDKQDWASLEKRDQASLQPVLRGDAKGWFDEIAREQNRRRVCGLSPIFSMLATTKLTNGKLVAYAQCPADERAGSVVSIASIVFEKNAG